MVVKRFRKRPLSGLDSVADSLPREPAASPRPSDVSISDASSSFVFVGKHKPFLRPSPKFACQPSFGMLQDGSGPVFRRELTPHRVDGFSRPVSALIMRGGPVLLLLRCRRRRPVMGHCFRCLLHFHILVLSPHRAALVLAPGLLLVWCFSPRFTRRDGKRFFSSGRIWSLTLCHIAACFRALLPAGFAIFFVSAF